MAVFDRIKPWVGFVLIRIQLQPGSGFSSLDPDSAITWIRIRIQQNIWIRFSDSGYETLFLSPVLLSVYGKCAEIRIRID
jgi:hypothetical protein